MRKNYDIGYRPDIDGLRAIAVLSVVLFHINKNLVTGGFSGVDIFFVISGYLITLHIYSQIKNKTFSFSDFYGRRINRIMPALFSLIACVSMIGFIVLSPMDLIRLVKSGFYAASGLSNIFFWREYGNYFSSGVNEAPLLHTWSLGVEEQFYVIWPIVLLLLARLKPKVTLAIVLLMLLMGIAVSEIGVLNMTSASYYLLPTRFFELLIGNALAILVFHRKSPFSRTSSTITGIAGILFTLASLFLITDTSLFPGLNAIYPCVSTALLIASGVDQKTFITRFLSMKPLVFIGLISYSIYLWHWPLIAYVNYLGIKIDAIAGMAIFAASIIFAWLSWKFVETPFRRSGATMPFLSTSGFRYAMPLTVIIFGFIGVVQADGFPSRFDMRVSQYEKIIATAPNELRSECHSPTLLYKRRPNPHCLLGAPSKTVDAFMIGDSYANHYTGMVDVLAKQEGISVMDYTMDGCMPVEGMGFSPIESYSEKCKARNNFSYDFIAKHKYKYVILAASWPNNGTKKSFSALQNGLEKSITTILSSGAEPIIILNNQGTANANCPVRRLLVGSSETCDKTRSAHVMQRHMFDKLKIKFPEIFYVNPNFAICENTICHSMINNIPLYRDSGHLNDVGSRLIGNILLEKGVTLIPEKK